MSNSQAATMPYLIRPLRHFLTVRAGCTFTYESTMPVPLLLNLKPRRDPWQALQEEKLVLGANLPSEEFEDSHGNIVYRLTLEPGRHEIRHDAIVAVPHFADNHEFGAGPAMSPAALPPSLLRYTLPSRYCDSDKMLAFAWEKFGTIPAGRKQVEAVCDWVHHNIAYRFGSGSPEISAWDVLQRGYGVCRDFAHLTVALCRALNLPTRYVTGWRFPCRHGLRRETPQRRAGRKRVKPDQQHLAPATRRRCEWLI